MYINVTESNQELIDALTIVNMTINDMNDTLKNIINIKKTTTQITEIYAKRLENIELLSNRANALINQRNIHQIHKTWLIEQIDLTKDRKKKKELKKQLKGTIEILEDIASTAMRTSTALNKCLNSASEESQKNHLEYLSNKMKKSLLILGENISDYKEIKKYILEQFGLNLPDIYLSDCVENISSGNINIVSTQIKPIQFYYYDDSLMSNTYTDHETTYLTENE